MLHRLARDEVEVPRGRVVLGIVKARGVGEVRVLAAKLCRALIHARNERLDRAADVLAENVARLVCRDDEHAVEQLLDRHRFAGDDVRRAAVAGEPLERRFRTKVMVALLAFEAIDRGMWDVKPETLERMKDIYLGLEERIEEFQDRE